MTDGNIPVWVCDKYSRWIRIGLWEGVVYILPLLTSSFFCVSEIVYFWILDVTDSSFVVTPLQSADVARSVIFLRSRCRLPPSCNPSACDRNFHSGNSVIVLMMWSQIRCFRVLEFLILSWAVQVGLTDSCNYTNGLSGCGYLIVLSRFSFISPEFSVSNKTCVSSGWI